MNPERRPHIDWVAVRRLLPLGLAGWFVVISALRLSVITQTTIGFDGRLYRAATQAWIAGADPWQVSLNGVYFAAPPPSLIPFVPLTWLPEDAAIGLLVAVCVLANILAIRRLGRPWWWIAFPPLVDGIWNANMHVLLVPLILAGLTPLAAIVKVYALAIPVIRGEIRAIALSVGLILVTVAILPWSQFLGQLPHVLDQLRAQSNGGLSVTTFPPLIAGVLVVLTVAALVVIGRERAAWLAVPALWPSTQWYYSSLALPGASAASAFVLAIPIQGGPVAAVLVLAAEQLLRRRAGLAKPDAERVEVIAVEPPRA